MNPLPFRGVKPGTLRYWKDRSAAERFAVALSLMDTVEELQNAAKRSRL